MNDLLLELIRRVVVACGERHAYMPSTEEEALQFKPHQWVRDVADQWATQAYAEGRKDQAEDQPVPEHALKLLDECMFFCAQAKESHMDQEDRQGGASGLHDALREYLLDVGYIWKPKASA